VPRAFAPTFDGHPSRRLTLSATRATSASAGTGLKSDRCSGAHVELFEHERDLLLRRHGLPAVVLSRPADDTFSRTCSGMSPQFDLLPRLGLAGVSAHAFGGQSPTGALVSRQFRRCGGGRRRAQLS